MFWLLVLFCCLISEPVASSPVQDDANLRQLLQNYQQNQDLIANLGTRYEIVYPVQIRPDWVRGLSTRLSSKDNVVNHLPQTSFIIETVAFKFHLDLDLNTNLLAPTLVQFLYLADSHVIIDKVPENCYYHATLRNPPGATAAFQTCNGLSGVIYLGNEVFFIHPLHGNHSMNHPHLLYHYFPEDPFMCGNEDVPEMFHCLQENSFITNAGKDIASANKFIELALVIDETLFEKQNSSPKEVIATAIQIINCVDLLYHPLNTSISLVYLELWIKDQIETKFDVEYTLNSFQEYTALRLSRISVDATHMLTGLTFKDEKRGLAFMDSICTSKAVGLSKVENPFKPHLSAYGMTHMIGHNLGMYHDHQCCNCSSETGCIMDNNVKFQSSIAFSKCSLNDYYGTLHKGYGACLFNMPKLRMSICGNGILEKEEECDCGTSEECLKFDSCCDPMTCKLIKHAQCSSGSCCKKCKLLSPDHMCRPAKGECDIPEFCDGQIGQCPIDLHKKNGAICYEGLGYCYMGMCPIMKTQCQEIWGTGADSANAICFERLNILGTPNGNCGSDGRGGIRKCLVEDSLCGSLQCDHGEKEPISGEKPVQFVIKKITSNGVIYKCKSKQNPFLSLDQELVKEGTKCGYHKMCVNQTCTSIKNIVSGSCPTNELRLVCSGHGVCTNINACFCEEGWSESDCSEIDVQSQFKKPKDDFAEHYESIEDSDFKTTNYGQNELKLNANLAVTVIAASTVIGIGLVIALVLILLYSRNILNGGCRRSYRYK